MEKKIGGTAKSYLVASTGASGHTLVTPTKPIRPQPGELPGLYVRVSPV